MLQQLIAFIGTHRAIVPLGETLCTMHVQQIVDHCTQRRVGLAQWESECLTRTSFEFCPRCIKRKRPGDGLGVALFIEHLPNVHYILGSIPACINQVWWHMM